MIPISKEETKEQQNKSCNYLHDFGDYCNKESIITIEVFYYDFEDGDRLTSGELYLCTEHYTEFKSDNGNWLWTDSGNYYARGHIAAN